MLNKKAKEILKKIQENAKRRKSYYVILKEYWPYGSFTDSAYQAKELGANNEIWSDIYKLNKRYERFCHYIKEIKPQWKEVDRWYFADNSVEAIQENIYGERRKVIVTGPHGDACY